MKALLLLVGLALAAACIAASIPVEGPTSHASVATCTTAFETNASAVNDNYDNNIDANSTYTGIASYTPGSNTSVCGVSFSLTTAGDVSGKTYTAVLRDQDADTTLATSAGITGSNAWSSTAVKFSWSPVSITTSGTYQFLITATGGADATNFVNVNQTAAGGLGGVSAQYNSSFVLQTFTTGDMKAVIYAP